MQGQLSTVAQPTAREVIDEHPSSTFYKLYPLSTNSNCLLVDGKMPNLLEVFDFYEAQIKIAAVG